jgi:hypothetical protein
MLVTLVTAVAEVMMPEKVEKATTTLKEVNQAKPVTVEQVATAVTPVAT